MAEIKAKMAVDGAAKFRSDMKEAKDAVKELDSELKLADSQFKATGNAQEYMETKSKVLKDQIEAQEKVIGLLKTRLEEAKTKYGENSSEVTKLKTELNKATTQQNNMKAALNNVKDPMNEVGNETGELADNAEDAATQTGTLKDNLKAIASEISLDAIKDFAQGVSSAIESAAQKAKELGVAVWNLGKEAGTTADDWLTMSTVTGLSVQEIQKFSYAGRFVDTTLDNITGSLTKFKRSVKDNKSLREVQKLIGATNKEMKAMSEMDMYWNVIDSIGEMYRGGDIDKAEDAAMKWFGRSAATMNPLFKAGREAFEELGEEAQNLGYILSDEEVANLGTFDDQMQKLDASVNALKLSLAESLLPVLTPVAEAFTKLSGELLTFLQSAEGQDAMKKLGDSLSAVVESFAADIPGAITSATDLVTDFADAFSDAETAVNTVKTAVITLASVWAGSKLVAFGADIVKAGAALKQLFPAFFGGGGGGATPTAPTTAPTVAPTVGKTGIFKGLGDFLSKPGTKAFAGVTAGLVTYFKPLVDNIKEDQKREQEIKTGQYDTSIIEAARKIGDTLKDANDTIESYMIDFGLDYEGAKEAYTKGKTYEDLVKENTVDFRKPVTAEQQEWAAEQQYYGKLQYSTDAYADALKRLDSALVDLGNGEGTDWLVESVEELQDLDMENIFSEDVINGLKNFDELAPEDLASWSQALRDQLAVAAKEAGASVPTSLVEGMQGTEMEAWEEMELIDEGIESEASSLQPSMTTAGYNGGMGFLNGLLQTKQRAMSAGYEVADAAKNGMKKALDEHSPSKVTEQIGYYASLGLANGLNDGIGTVSEAVGKVMGAVSGTPIYGSSGVRSGSVNPDAFVSALNGAQVVMDGETVGRLIFPRINTELGRVQQRRYA